MEVVNVFGRRKILVVCVYLMKGLGKIIVNNCDYKEVFIVVMLQDKIVQLFKLIEIFGQYDIKVNVQGGGINGQVEVICLGIFCGFVKVFEDLKLVLKVEGLMICDLCMVECKKLGQLKVCKKFQFFKC